MDARTEPHLQLVGHRKGIHDVAWSPAADLVATGSGDESTRLWNPVDGRLVTVLPDAGPVYRVSWSPDGSRIATSGHGARLTVHDVATARTLATFEAPYLLVRGATWSPDGQRIATATGGDNVVVLSSEECEIVDVVRHLATDVAYSPDGEWLAVAGNVGILLLDKSLEQHRLATASASAVAWSRDSSRLAASTASGCYVWSVPDGRLVAALPYSAGGPLEWNTSGRLAWRADGRRLAVPDENGVAIWDLDEAAEVDRLTGPTAAVSAVAWSGDGTRVATGAGEPVGWIWDLTVDPEPRRDVAPDPAPAPATGTHLFISYSHRDERFARELEKHLAVLRRQGLVNDWSDRRLEPGDSWAQAIDAALERTTIFLLLVSPDFLASDYCYDVEMHRALERHRSGAARVLPVIVKPADWQNAPFGELQALPDDAKPVVNWRNRDEAWLNVVQRLRAILETIQSA